MPEMIRPEWTIEQAEAVNMAVAALYAAYRGDNLDAFRVSYMPAMSDANRMVEDTVKTAVEASWQLDDLIAGAQMRDPEHQDFLHLLKMRAKGSPMFDRADDANENGDLVTLDCASAVKVIEAALDDDDPEVRDAIRTLRIAHVVDEADLGL